MAAEIKAEVDGTPGSNDMPGRLVFHTTSDGAAGTTERARINSDGRLLVNSTVARNVSTNINRMIQVESSGGGAGIAVVRNSDNANGPSLDLGKSRGYPNTIVQSGDELGQIRFGGADGTNLESAAAQIKVEVDGTPGENDMPGRLTFHTTADGAASPTEKLRITSDGKMGFGTDNPSSKLHILAGGGSCIIELQRDSANTTGNVGCINFTASDGHSVANMGAYGDGDNDGAYINFKTTSAASANSPFTATTEQVRITSGGQLLVPAGTQAAPSLSFLTNSDAGFYTPADNNIGVVIDGDEKYEFGLGNFIPSDDNSRDLGQASFRWDDVRATNGSIVTSDRNEKNTIVASDLGLDFVNKLTPVSYKFNNKTRTHYGLIAQDIETVLGTISKPATDFAGFCKDTITEDGDGNALDTPFDRYGLRYTEFISPMIKAIQELSAENTALTVSYTHLTLPTSDLV